MLQNWSASPERFAGLPELLDSLEELSDSSLRYATWRILASETKATSIPQEIRSKVDTRIRKLEVLSSTQTTSVTQMHQQLEASITAQIVSRWLQTADSANDAASTGQ